MMSRIFIQVCLLSGLLLSTGCSLSESNEIVILLPGRIKGNPLVLAETSSTEISINGDLVPSLILKVWWDENIIVTENHPMALRNRFPGDKYRVPDRAVRCWYIIHPQSDTVLYITDRDELEGNVKRFGVNPQDVRLYPLHRARAIREKQMGFAFTASSVNDYLQAQRKKEIRNDQ